MAVQDDPGTGGGTGGGGIGSGVMAKVKSNKGKIVVVLGMIAILIYVTSQGSAG